MFSVDSARALELDALLELVGSLASTDLGRQEVRNLGAAAAAARLVEVRAATLECRSLCSEGLLVPACEDDFIPLLALLGDPFGDIDGPMLRRLEPLLAAGVESARRITEADQENDRDGGELSQLCPGLAGGAELLGHLRRVLDRRGRVRDQASPKLAQLRGRVRRARAETRQAVEEVVATHGELLSDGTIPQRHGRFVVKLKSGSKGRIEGLVHDRSGTGKSLYFEPLVAIEGNNELRRKSSEAEAEERRILAELIDAFRTQTATLESLAKSVATLDRYQASVRFAQLSQGRIAATSGDGNLRLVAARHPLLDPLLADLRAEVFGQAGHRGPMVPLDLELGGDLRALVISGPNAGGKTVAMKTVGLLAAMHHCGLPIPSAEGSEIPELSAIVAAIGDQQDMLAEESTFSSKLSRLEEAWELRRPDVLVLLDELGDGTGPEEGAALGIALLEALVEAGSLVVITTHLVQLAAATERLDGASSASMEFDGGPTFRLVAGAPGASEAIALGRRLGLPERWLQRAEELLGSEYRNLRELMAKLEERRQSLEDVREQVKVELADAEILRQRVADEHERVTEERKTMRSRFAREWSELRAEVRDRLDRELRDLAKLRRTASQGGRRSKNSGKPPASPPKSLAALTERTIGSLPAELQLDAVPAESLEVGARVEHRLYRWQGRLIDIKGKRAEVRVGGKVVRCELGQLELQRPRAERTSKTRSPAIYPDVGEAVGSELNLVGQRVQPALEKLERYLDQAILSAHSSVRIVHGFGSGRLRTAVRERVRSHPGVAAFRPAHPSRGGDGATEIELDEHHPGRAEHGTR